MPRISEKEHHAFRFGIKIGETLGVLEVQQVIDENEGLNKNGLISKISKLLTKHLSELAVDEE